MYFGLSGLKEHVAQQAIKYRRGVRNLKDAGFVEYRGIYMCIDDGVEIVEAVIGPDNRSVWVRTKKKC